MSLLGSVMLSAAPPSSVPAKSSLEEMLESIRQRDEHSKDGPPALPSRPTSRARLPSSRRSLPINFKVGDTPPGHLPNGFAKTEVKQQPEPKISRDKESCFKSGAVFGSKKLLKVDILADSPYSRTLEKENHIEEVNEIEDSVSEEERVPGSLSNGECTRPETINYILRKKLRVWCQLPNAQWELGRIQSISGEDVVVALPDGKVAAMSTEDILPSNPDILEGIDDLIQLSYLNEPSVLHNLRKRYSCDKVYTKAGPVLVAVNPFKEVPLYGSDTVAAYRQKFMDNPHVYAVADAAFSGMMQDEINQSIIISGESGAGKTETAKIAMQYLATLGGGSGMEYEILKTNCVLEAFGNAKTSRNDNSSRFGKLIEIQFGVTGKICGAKIQTFLLEKSRVVQRPKGERSYHIFYQLCAGASPSLKERLNLKSASEYYYLKLSDCLTIDDLDDACGFRILMEALDIVQICKEHQENAFQMLAAILWLGNISFSVVDNENHIEVDANEGVTTAAKLLGCNVEDLMLALCTRTIRAGNDDIIQRLTLSQAIDTRDALAKSIYASLFDWLVDQINKSLKVGAQQSGRSISILDIYGFESFENNSFEQFCINYANERLQQHFNRHLFKLEQEEYSQDGIDWTKVDFEDNQECLDLFEKKPLGLLSLLDEESTFPRATDLTFAAKLKQHLHENPCFKGERSGAFSVLHYAGEKFSIIVALAHNGNNGIKDNIDKDVVHSGEVVKYDTSGFLEKNRDTLHSNLIRLLASCNCPLPQLFASNMHYNSEKAVRSIWHLSADCQKQSVGSKFKGQLFKLMQRLENSAPHFIRCIKPNSKQLPGVFERDLVLQQLRCCGVLEVVRISRFGYPTRMTHQQFATRYGFLLAESDAFKDPLSISVAVLQKFNIQPDLYQVGYTKLFFRTGQIGALEDARNRILQGILTVQKYFRGQQARCHFKKLKEGAITLQSHIRGQIARKELSFYVKQQRAAALIQKHFRQWTSQKTLYDHQKAVIRLQSVIRGHLARRHFARLFSEALKLEGSIVAKPDRRSPQLKDVVESDVDVTLTELQTRLCKAEAALRDKEDENVTLQEQLKQYEMRWLEYEAKMKSMEEMWQKQMASLQTSLAAARRNLAADYGGRMPPGRPDISLAIQGYDSEDAQSVEYARTPEETPSRSHDQPTNSGMGVSDGARNAIGHLMKEFDQRKQVFDDDAGFLIEVKSGQTVSHLNPDEELRRLKLRFSAWKRDYKVRLRETKTALQKLGNPDAEKTKKKWWGKRSTRGT